MLQSQLDRGQVHPDHAVPKDGGLHCHHKQYMYPADQRPHASFIAIRTGPRRNRQQKAQDRRCVDRRRHQEKPKQLHASCQRLDNAGRKGVSPQRAKQCTAQQGQGYQPQQQTASTVRTHHVRCHTGGRCQIGKTQYPKDIQRPAYPSHTVSPTLPLTKTPRSSSAP